MGRFRGAVGPAAPERLARLETPLRRVGSLMKGVRQSPPPLAASKSAAMGQCQVGGPPQVGAPPFSGGSPRLVGVPPHRPPPSHMYGTVLHSYLPADYGTTAEILREWWVGESNEYELERLLGA